MCTTLKEQVRTYTNNSASNYSERLKKFFWNGQLLGLFGPELQKLLKPIYDLTRKGRPFVWGKEQQDSFEKIKGRLIKQSVLYMSNKTGRFHLYSDTSKFASGSALYQDTKWKAQIDCICIQKASRSCKKVIP